MIPFEFSSTPKIIFGNGKIKQLPTILKTFGTNILIITGKNSFQNSESGKCFFDSLKADENIDIHTIVVSNEPSPNLINNSMPSLRKKKIDVVVSIGGGSVIDAGKAISAMMYEDNPIEDYLERRDKREHSGRKVPFVAVPTTSGTGSEVTNNAVISKIGADGFKLSLRHENFVPNIALIDPMLTLSMPQNITAYTGMDCFSQLVESYLSSEGSPLTETLAQQGLKAISSSFLKAYEEGNNIDARTDMSYAALLSGLCLNNAGLGVVHGFAAPIGGRLNIPHGIVCGSMMAAANEVNVKKLKSTPSCDDILLKYARLGLLFCGKKADATKEYYADAFVDYLKMLTDKFQFPKYDQYGLAEDMLLQILKKSSCKNNPIALTPVEMRSILMKCYRN